MEAKKILDDSLKQDGFFSQESVMPQYHSCIKAVQKALTTSLTDTEEKMYSLSEVEEIHVSVMKQGCLYEGGSWSDEHERLIRLEFHKWIEKNL